MAEEVEHLMGHLNFQMKKQQFLKLLESLAMNKWLVTKVITSNRVNGEAVMKSFDGDLMSICDFDPTLSVEEYDFSKMPIWIRVFDLPLGLIDEISGFQIGNTVGKVVVVDLRNREGHLWAYLCICAEIDIKKPIRRCLNMGKRPDGKLMSCLLKYERLPNFCHWCGIIGNTIIECPTYIANQQEILQYEDWLRVTSLGSKLVAATIEIVGKVPMKKRQPRVMVNLVSSNSGKRKSGEELGGTKRTKNDHIKKDSVGSKSSKLIMWRKTRQRPLLGGVFILNQRWRLQSSSVENHKYHLL
ncbi:hypothetical protein F3Y22_tig00110328pilonHSYRG00622 [Hibiscus syriacus]|uniref:DUF4283 domain-containing protein n=1 Tax=Hibiscus syriacus TaxID=106335 RepID=A0A6A3AZF5_HIBSY|nr:hypothetical protein F3Y22_tig00110328pilonHSYRG00622 [Hibiscus syriacus]